MLLHSGSGFHKHEYSAPTSPTTTSPILKRSSLVRSAFTTPATRPLPVRHDSIKASLRPTSFADVRRHTGGVSFVEPPASEMEDDLATETMSEDGKSLTSREGSEATFAGGRRSSRRKKIRRVTTSYALAHPAPTLLQKQQFLHVRPQLLLQMQRISADTRPMPILDVLPSAVFVPRLAKKFPVMFKGRGGLGPNDILCVKSEDYRTSTDRGDSSNSSDSDEEGWAAREVEAVICQARKGDARATGQAEIVFSNGSKWTAIPLSGSIFEFSSVNEHGLKTTARWVRRSTQRSNSELRDKVPTTPSSKTDSKFNFSIIDPNSRRHPVIASITPNALDIPDTYTLLSPTPAIRSGDTSPTNTAGNDNQESPELPEKTSVPVSDHLRKLIQITGVWVALRQGWSPNFKYDDFSPACKTPFTSSISSKTTIIPQSQNTPNSTTSSHIPDTRGRSVSLDYKPRQQRIGTQDFNGGGRAGAETPDSMHSSFSSSGLGGISGFGKIRRFSGQHRNSMGKDGVCDFASGAGRKQKVKPQRSTSTGAAFMARVAARKGVGAGAGTGSVGPPSTVASDSDGESLDVRSEGGDGRGGSTLAFGGTTFGGTTFAGAGNKAKLHRLSSPSPLAVASEAVEMDVPSRPRPVSTPHPSPNLNPNQHPNPNRTSLAAASAGAALAGNSPSSFKRHDEKQKEKGKGRWGRFIGVFKRSGR